jgi:hypothetical protein
MKWLVLISLFACTSPSQNAPTAGESNAKPVTASEVKAPSCLCNKMYMPVCADGIDYGNSCEAECHGHKKWVDGNCPEVK